MGGSSGVQRSDKEWFLLQLSESERTAFGRGEAFLEQAFPQKVFSTVWELETNLRDGGFLKYFWNAGRLVVQFTAAALQAVGATRSAEICRRAIACAFPGGIPPLPLPMQRSPEAFSLQVTEALAQLERDLGTSSENLVDLLYQYVGTHAEEFGRLGD